MSNKTCTGAASRRHFLRWMGGLSALSAQRFSVPLATGLAGIGALASQSSSAASTSGPYRALVCLFMNGGNDSHNWIVPTDATGYAEYTAARGEIAWPAAKLLSLTQTSQGAGRSFGMADDLTPLRTWYEAGRTAVVANVGPLVRPLTKSQYLAGGERPSKLFSHNDQASTWQSLSPEGAASGWGGRMGDLLASANSNPVFTAVSTNGNVVFLTGQQVTQYSIGTDGPVKIGVLNSNSVFGSAAGPAALRRVLARGGSVPLQGEVVNIGQRSVDAAQVLQSALANVAVPAIPATPITLGTGSTITLDTDSLARQLRMVAQMIGANQVLGMKRQVFMVSMSGFDTHANQMRDQPSLMARVALSIDYFMNAMSSMGLMDNVTLFTASDFGRALLSNGSGCDHGWGGHHVVCGGAVKGREIYGRFPSTALGSNDDIGSGRLLPSSSVSQMVAPMGRWFGLSDTDLSTVLPGIDNFDSRALGFI